MLHASSFGSSFIPILVVALALARWLGDKAVAALLDAFGEERAGSGGTGGGARLNAVNAPDNGLAELLAEAQPVAGVANPPAAGGMLSSALFALQYAMAAYRRASVLWADAAALLAAYVLASAVGPVVL
jgi:hypothetical protein